VPAPKWFVIARNEYRIRTSSIRGIRPYFPYLIIGFLVVFVGYIAPALINPLFGIIDIPAFFISLIAVAIMQIILLMFFFYFMIFPIGNTLKDVRTEEYEIFLSAPIKPSDVLLGKFMGVMPFYAIGIVVVTGVFTAFLAPLGLGMIQIAIIVMIFIVTFLSALWIGTVIAAVLRTKLSKSPRGKDIGKALPLLIALPMIALMYALFAGGFVEALADPRTGGIIKTILLFFPSSWGAELMVLFAFNPGNIAAVWFETLTRFGGLILFFVATLWLGAKAANRAYSLETTTFTASVAKPDGTLYGTVKSLGGGKSFGTLLVSIFKDYGRRFENISKIVYIVGILVLVTVFFGMDLEEPMDALIQGFFFFPLLAVFVIGEVTVRGKENFFLYRKAPAGEGRLVKARFLHAWLVVIPIVVVYAVISLIFVPQITIIDLFAHTGLLVLIITANVAFVLGLFLLMPVFSDKPAELMGNMMIVMFVSIFLFIFSGIIFGRNLGILVLIIISWLLGIVFLYLGKRNLSKIE